MEMTLGALIAAAGFALGWLGKLFTAGKKSGKDEAAAEHLQRDFNEHKADTASAFSAVHGRIDRMKDRQAEMEIRQGAKFDELIKGQGLIEGKLSAMIELLDRRQK